MAKTRAQANRAIRQDSLREYMVERGSVQYLFDLLEKIEALDPAGETFQHEHTKLKTALDMRHKLLAKYLPDNKAVEVTGEGGGALSVNLMNYSVD